MRNNIEALLNNTRGFALTTDDIQAHLETGWTYYQEAINYLSLVTPPSMRLLTENIFNALVQDWEFHTGNEAFTNDPYSDEEDADEFVCSEAVAFVLSMASTINTEEDLIFITNLVEDRRNKPYSSGVPVEDMDFSDVPPAF